MRVRMGLHSGEPVRHEDGYVGLDVHRAARIAAVAHGGQVVLSEATRQLAGSRLPAGASLRDLGLHRLKDIEAPEHIYQLVVAGLLERFPPLNSTRRRRYPRQLLAAPIVDGCLMEGAAGRLRGGETVLAQLVGAGVAAARTPQ